MGVTPIDFGAEPKDSMKGALEALKRNSETMIEYACLVATIRRKSFLAHIAEGFTEAQALELCKQL